MFDVVHGRYMKSFYAMYTPTLQHSKKTALYSILQLCQITPRHTTLIRDLLMY